mmetsp:Transcript_33048/g.91299  ORF Transcript_33048/g.91299 Transcript_33048/m.91299 type:complete len:203 (-) Transcript_33048:2277-2885(-)
MEGCGLARNCPSSATARRRRLALVPPWGPAAAGTASAAGWAWTSSAPSASGASLSARAGNDSNGMSRRCGTLSSSQRSTGKRANWASEAAEATGGSRGCGGRSPEESSTSSSLSRKASAKLWGWKTYPPVAFAIACRFWSRSVPIMIASRVTDSRCSLRATSQARQPEHVSLPSESTSMRRDTPACKEALFASLQASSSSMA